MLAIVSIAYYEIPSLNRAFREQCGNLLPLRKDLQDDEG